MYSIPKEGEGSHTKIQRWCDGCEVIHVLDGVHAYSAEWLDVGVAMMYGMDVGVEGFYMNQSMGEVKVDFSK